MAAKRAFPKANPLTFLASHEERRKCFGPAWTIALQVREVNSGAARREAREKLLEAARRREIDVVLVWRLDRWGRSVTDLLATLQELEHLGLGFVYLTEALDLTTPAGGRTAGIENFHRRLGRTEGRQPRSLSLACCLTARHSWVRAAFRPNCPAGLTDNYGLSYGPAPPG